MSDLTSLVPSSSMPSTEPAIIVEMAEVAEAAAAAVAAEQAIPNLPAEQMEAVQTTGPTQGNEALQKVEPAVEGENLVEPADDADDLPPGETAGAGGEGEHVFGVVPLNPQPIAPGPIAPPDETMSTISVPSPTAGASSKVPALPALTAKRRPGRPRKPRPGEPVSMLASLETTEPAKRRPGRPRLPRPGEPGYVPPEDRPVPVPAPGKRRPGRPRKPRPGEPGYVAPVVRGLLPGVPKPPAAAGKRRAGRPSVPKAGEAGHVAVADNVVESASAKRRPGRPRLPRPGEPGYVAPEDRPVRVPTPGKRRPGRPRKPRPGEPGYVEPTEGAMRAGVAKGRVKKGGRGKRAATVGVADAVAMATVAMISAMTALAALSGVLSEPAAAATPVRRGPGRPRKRALNPGEATPSQETGAVQVVDGQSGEQGVTPAKRRRGRLRKNPLTVEMTLPPSGSETVAQSNVEGDSVPVSAELGAMKPSENMNVVLPGPVAGPQ